MSNKKGSNRPEYLDIVRLISDVAPVLKKYKKRKKLRPQEKAAITRFWNNYNKIEHRDLMVPISKRQYKTLKDKSSIIKGGFRAARFNNLSEDASVHVQGGHYVIKSSKRHWIYHEVPLDFREFKSHAVRIFARGKVVSLHVWTNKGRAAHGYYSTAQLFPALETLYFARYSEIGEWLLGYAYHILKK